MLQRDDPLSPLKRRVARGGFKTVELNLAGWSALLGAGAAAGALAALTTGASPVVAVPAGAAAAWAVALILDHRRWRKGLVHLVRDFLDPVAGAEVVRQLEAMGIPATYREDVFEEEEYAEAYVQRSIECRQVHARRVEEVLAERAPRRGV